MPLCNCARVTLDSTLWPGSNQRHWRTGIWLRSSLRRRSVRRDGSRSCSQSEASTTRCRWSSPASAVQVELFGYTFFGSARYGAVFYVAAGQAEYCRSALVAAGLELGVVEEEPGA